jgi:hypothetical protein
VSGDWAMVECCVCVSSGRPARGVDCWLCCCILVLSTARTISQGKSVNAVLVVFTNYTVRCSASALVGSCSDAGPLSKLLYKEHRTDSSPRQRSPRLFRLVVCDKTVLTALSARCASPLRVWR